MAATGMLSAQRSSTGAMEVLEVLEELEVPAVLESFESVQ